MDAVIERVVPADGAARLAQCARELAQRGWMPATSSNLSLRLGAGRVAITASGRDKAKLTADDVIVVDDDGRALDGHTRPSAETGLHLQLYRRFPGVGCVLHTHSIQQTVAARLCAREGLVRLSGYELLKAFTGCETHATTVELPVFANDQDIPALAARIADFTPRGPFWGYLIDGHGLYAWGRDLPEACRHLEAFEALLACELTLRMVAR